MDRQKMDEFEMMVTNLGMPAAEQLYSKDSPFMRYRMDLDEYISEHFDVYEEKTFRYIFRKCFTNSRRNNSLWWTEGIESISKKLNISEEQLRKKVIPSLEKRGFLKREKLHRRSPYTYIITLPGHFLTGTQYRLK